MIKKFLDFSLFFIEAGAEFFTHSIGRYFEVLYISGNTKYALFKSLLFVFASPDNFLDHFRHLLVSFAERTLLGLGSLLLGLLLDSMKISLQLHDIFLKLGHPITKFLQLIFIHFPNILVLKAILAAGVPVTFVVIDFLDDGEQLVIVV